MNHILTLYLNKFIMVYLDDIPIYSKSEEEHAEHVEKVLQALKDNDLFCHPQKLAFEFHKVRFIGHIISSDGITVDRSKVQAVREWPQSTNVLKVHSFLGLTSYY